LNLTAVIRLEMALTAERKARPPDKDANSTLCPPVMLAYLGLDRRVGMNCGLSSVSGVKEPLRTWYDNIAPSLSVSLIASFVELKNFAKAVFEGAKTASGSISPQCLSMSEMGLYL
jgi:hypothetical protein